MVTLHEVITFLVSMQISISSLQTHNVNRCGRSRHLARKLSLRRKRSSPNVFEMAATETITSIILIKLIRVSLGTVRHPRRFKIVVIDIQITLKQMLRDFIGIRVNRAKKSGMVNITSSVNYCWRKMRKFDLSLRSSRSSYFATFRHQLTILSKTDALDEEKWLNMLGTFVKDWFRYESHFVHGRDSLVDILKERGLLSESDAVQPLIGKKS